MKKKMWIVGIVVVTVAGIGVTLLLGNLDSLVAKVIRTEGSKVTATRVDVSGVHIELRAGRAAIAGLTIANPSDFPDGEVFSLGRIAVDLELESVRKEPLVISSVTVEAPDVAVVFDAKGHSNLDALRSRLDSYKAAATDPEGATATQRRLRIDTFVFAKGQIAVDATALGLGKRDVVLPELRLSGVGGPDGATPDRIVKETLGAIAAQTAREIAQTEVQQRVQDALGDAVDAKAKGLLDKIRNSSR